MTHNLPTSSEKPSILMELATMLIGALIFAGAVAATIYLSTVKPCTVCADTSTTDRSSLVPVADRLDGVDLEVLQQALHGYLTQPGKSRAYLFVDPDCAVCDQAVHQAVNSGSPVLLVPLAVYGRGDDIAKANTELFLSMGFSAMPLWILRPTCNQPAIVVSGELSESEFSQLQASHGACQGDSAPASAAVVAILDEGNASK